MKVLNLFLVLTCKIEALFYATSTNIMGVFYDGNSSVPILTASNVKLNYDKTAERLIYYDVGDLKTVKLDGSDIRTIGTVSLHRFTVDFMERKVYYLTSLFRALKAVQIENGTITDVSGSLGSSIDDLDIDITNK